MIEVELPDGTVIEFDGTDEAQAQRAAAKWFKENRPEQYQSERGARQANRLNESPQLFPGSATAQEKIMDSLSLGMNDVVSAGGKAGWDWMRGRGEFGDLYNQHSAYEDAYDKTIEQSNPTAALVGSGLGIGLNPLSGKIARGAGSAVRGALPAAGRVGYWMLDKAAPYSLTARMGRNGIDMLQNSPLFKGLLK